MGVDYSSRLQCCFHPNRQVGKQSFGNASSPRSFDDCFLRVIRYFRSSNGETDEGEEGRVHLPTEHLAEFVPIVVSCDSSWGALLNFICLVVGNGRRFPQEMSLMHFNGYALLTVGKWE